jgi:hypothetical protein
VSRKSKKQPEQHHHDDSNCEECLEILILHLTEKDHARKAMHKEKAEELCKKCPSYINSKKK